MSSKQDDYLLGTSDKELERLGFQHQVWQGVTDSLWRKAGFSFGQDLVDLGCGPGFATLELARLVGHSGSVQAIDASERFVNHLNHQVSAAGLANVTTRVADVHDLDLPDESADGIFARWLMCFVLDPAKVCAEIARALRPGGVFAVWDYFNYSAVKVLPVRSGITKLFECYYESTSSHGGSYDIGEELPRMLIGAGLELSSIEPICRIGRPGSTLWRWVSSFHDSYLPKLIEQGLMSVEEAETFRSDWSEASKDPSTYFFAPPMVGIVARKPGRVLY
jgi:ubiquinone/menaquinone biosynthesis C-methylase UbiE